MVIQSIGSDLYKVGHLLQISTVSGDRPHSAVAAQKMLKKSSPAWPPSYHTFIILLERHRKLVMYVQLSTVIGFGFIQRQF